MIGRRSANENNGEDNGVENTEPMDDLSSSWQFDSVEEEPGAWDIGEVMDDGDSEEIARLAADRTRKSDGSFEPKGNGVSAPLPDSSVRRGENDPRVLRARQIAANLEAARAAAAEAEEKAAAAASNTSEVNGKGLDDTLVAPIETDDFPEFRRETAVENDSSRHLELDSGSEAEGSIDRDLAEEFTDDPFGLEDEFDRGSDRNLGVAALVGIVLAAVAAALLWISEYTAIALVGVGALLAVAELYDSMSSVGLRPAKLLGYVATVAIPAAAFFRGEPAFPMVLALTVVFGVLWYLAGADYERPVLNFGLTILGVMWIGGLVGFAGLLLGADYEMGRQVLLAAIAVTAVSDIFAYFGGRGFGHTPFHRASPNKTWEGTISGFLAALAFGLILGFGANFVGDDVSYVFRDNFGAAMAFAAVIGLLAPVGDLAQSLVKRDLGVKDMGTLLPGHGGVFDRVDGLLFALPAAYYCATFFDLITPVF